MPIGYLHAIQKSWHLQREVSYSWHHERNTVKVGRIMIENFNQGTLTQYQSFALPWSDLNIPIVGHQVVLRWGVIRFLFHKLNIEKSMRVDGSPGRWQNVKWRKKPTTLLFFKPIVSSVQLILKYLIENITYSSYIWSTDVLIKLHTTKYESMFTWILMPYTSYYLFITCQWWWRRIFMSI